MAVGAPAAAVVAAAAAVALLAVASAAGAPASGQPRMYADFIIAIRTRLQLLQTPQPQAVDVYPHLQNVKTSENVVPRQTVLHRCDKVACCGGKNPDLFHCVPAVQNVTLHFYASELGSPRKRFIVQQFQNHTRCDCLSQSEGL